MEERKGERETDLAVLHRLSLVEKTSVPSPRGTSGECCPLHVVVMNFKSRGHLSWIYCNWKKRSSNLYEPTTWSLITRE